MKYHRITFVSLTASAAFVALSLSACTADTSPEVLENSSEVSGAEQDAVTAQGEDDPAADEPSETESGENRSSEDSAGEPEASRVNSAHDPIGSTQRVPSTSAHIKPISDIGEDVPRSAEAAPRPSGKVTEPAVATPPAPTEASDAEADAVFAPHPPTDAEVRTSRDTDFAPDAQLDEGSTSKGLSSCGETGGSTLCRGLSWVSTAGASGSPGAASIMLFHNGEHIGIHDHEQGIGPVVRRIDDSSLTITRRIPPLANGQAEGQVVTRLQWDPVEEQLHEQTTSTVARVDDGFETHP